MNEDLGGNLGGRVPSPAGRNKRGGLISFIHFNSFVCSTSPENGTEEVAPCKLKSPLQHVSDPRTKERRSLVVGFFNSSSNRRATGSSAIRLKRLKLKRPPLAVGPGTAGYEPRDASRVHNDGQYYDGFKNAQVRLQATSHVVLF